MLPALAFVLVGLAGTGALAQVSERPRQPYSLVISGGVSLGAYEAGLLWTLTRLVEQEGGRVVGVAGASAGAINGMLTALAVCSDQGAPGSGLTNPFRSPGLEGNPFHDAWLAVGAADLLPSEARDPGTGGPPGSESEGVLARGLVDDLFQRLRSLVDTAGLWRAGCDLPLAVTVTCAVPTMRTRADIPMPVQRFAIPLKVRSATVGKVTRLTFDNQVEVLRRAREAGDVLFLAERVDYANGLHPQDVLDAVRASSSFPLAFGPTELTYCVPADQCPEDLPTPAEKERLERRNAAYTCRNLALALSEGGLSPWRVPGRPDPALTTCTSRFVDGGVFDNAPLGLAVAQSESDAAETGTASRNDGREPVTYLVIDPDLRRHGPEATLKPNVGRRGVRRVGAVLAEVVTTARGQALHDALRLVRFNASPQPLLDAASKKLAEARELLSTPGSPARKKLAWDGVPEREQERMVRDLAETVRLLDESSRGVAAGLDAGTWGPELARFVQWATARQEKAGARPGMATLYEPLSEPLALARTLLADPREARRLVTLRRFPPLAASQLANFGAFLDPPFRQHDFAAGVYDAAEGLAEYGRATDPREDPSERTARLLRSLRLNAPDAGPAAAVVATLTRHFLALEWSPYDAAPETVEGCLEGRGEPVRPVCTVALALQSQRAECAVAADTSRCFDDPPFVHFLERLRDAGYRPVSDEMRAMLENRRWWALLTARALLRLSEIEQDELAAIERDVSATTDQPDAVRRANEGAAEAQQALVSVVRQSAYWLRAYADARDAFEADPSTVPDDGHGLWAWHLLPYWLEIDPVRAGAGIGYEPGFSWGWGELRMRLAAARYWADDHVTPFVVRNTLATHATLNPCGASFACDREHHASSAAGLTLALPDLGTRMLSLGVGVEADLGWLNRLVQFSGSVYVGTLLDRLRLKVGARVAEWDVAGGGAPYLRRGAWLWDLRLELADLNGILWEAAR